MSTADLDFDPEFEPAAPAVPNTAAGTDPASTSLPGAFADVQSSQALLNDCWNRIGVFGDRSCPELLGCVHCRNCPVYSAAGRSLLERLPPDDYLQEWTTVLAETKRGSENSTLSADGSVVRSDQSLSVMIFRLARELFALPVGVFLEVSSPFGVHSVPGRSNQLFLGLVNVRGEIMLAASLTNLLGLTLEQGSGQQPAGRMAVAGTPEGKWVFPIDEIYGIYLFHRDDVKPAPVVISHADHAYTSGVFQWQNRSVALLDPDRIFSVLTAEISPP
jgi:chemotaxis-related protein WspD